MALPLHERRLFVGMAPASELAHLWAQEHLGVERAIGQILQHLVQLHTTADVQRLALAQLRAEVNHLHAMLESPSAPPAAKPKKPPRPR
jgi:hypothetical protein